MKLLYINPPPNPALRYKEKMMPLSLLYLSAIAYKQCETKILDLKVVPNSTAEPGDTYLKNVDRTITEFQPHIVGLTCLFSGDITSILKIATFIKSKYPQITIICGGMHPTLFAKEIIQHCTEIDIVLIGEGEETTSKLLSAISNEESFDTIDGIAYRKYGNRPMLTAYDSNGCVLDHAKKCIICHIPKKKYIQDISELPMPAYELFHFEDYFCDMSHWYNPNNVAIKGASVPILTSRSCPTSCNFCSMNQVMGLSYRAKSAKAVVDEMSYLYDRYNVRYFSIMDDNFTLDKKRTIQICDSIIAKNMNIALECSSGLFINSLDNEVIDALVSAGLIMTAVAIESGSDYIRNQVIGKSLRREKIYDVVSSFNRYSKVYLYGFFVFGFPEDTEETIGETLKMIEELDLDDISVNPIVPLPGTRLFTQCEEEKLFLHEVDFDNLWRHEGFFCTPYVSQFFIKPYSLSLQQLEKYYDQFKQLKQQKRAIAKSKGKCLGNSN